MKTTFFFYNSSVKKERYYTTGQFSSKERPYHRNCGPTAITNAILTLDPKEEDPKEIYEDVARIGRRRLTYWNSDLFHLFGGTVDILTPSYLRKVFRKEGIEHARVLKRRVMKPERVLEAITKGHLLYIQFRHHKKYGNHHVIAYGGYEEGDQFYVKIADGWKASPSYIPLSELGRGYIIEIIP